MSNVPSIPRCFLFQTKQRDPMSVLINLNGCRLSENQLWFLSSFIQLWKYLQSADQRWHLCREGLPFAWITAALSLKAHDANAQRQCSCSTVKAESRLCYCRRGLGLGLFWLIFGSAKLICQSDLWNHVIKNNPASCDATLELRGGKKETVEMPKLNKLTSDGFPEMIAKQRIYILYIWSCELRAVFFRDNICFVFNSEQIDSCTLGMKPSISAQAGSLLTNDALSAALCTWKLPR